MSAITKSILFPLSLLYWACGKLHWRLCRVKEGALPLPALPLVVVGALRTGGAGKTAAVISLAETFSAMGLRTAVMARRLKGPALAGPCRPIGDNWKHSSDEAVLIRRRTGADVYVTRSRADLWARLSQTGRYDLLLSDDGFQDPRLAGAFHLVLTRPGEHPGIGSLLPAGPFRQTASALKRASVILQEQNLDSPLTPCPSIMPVQNTVKGRPCNFAITAYGRGNPNSASAEHSRGAADSTISEHIRGVPGSAVEEYRQEVSDDAAEEHSRGASDDAAEERGRVTPYDAAEERSRGAADDAGAEHSRGAADSTISEHSRRVPDSAVKEYSRVVSDDAGAEQGQGIPRPGTFLRVLDIPEGLDRAAPWIVLCALGDNTVFVSMLKREGFSIARVHTRMDHRPFSPAFIKNFLVKYPGCGILMTEKDAVKLKPGTPRVTVIPLNIVFHEGLPHQLLMKTGAAQPPPADTRTPFRE